MGTVSAMDSDSGEIFTYSLSDDAGGRFAIDPDTGEITVADGSLLDYESASSHDITIQVTDSAGNSYSEEMTLNLTDANETPTDLTLSDSGVAENAANGTVVGTVATTDPDSGDSFTYSLTDNAGGRFAVNAETGEITVLDGSLLDFENSGSHDITVQVTDSGGNTFSEVMTLNLSDENEAPTDISLSNNTISENAANGSAVGTASATDQDSGESFTYSLTNDAGGRFAIDPETGEITVADASHIDYSVHTTLNITIQVTDSAGNSFDESMTIGVNNVEQINTSNYNAVDQGYTVTARSIDSNGNLTAASADNILVTNSGLGVAGTAGAATSQLGYHPVHGVSEEMNFDFDNPVESASVSITGFYAGEGNGGEQGHWQAYDNGVLVGESDFSAPRGTSMTLSIDLGPGISFDQLVFTATEYVDGQGDITSNSSEYYIQSMDVEWSNLELDGLPGAGTAQHADSYEAAIMEHDPVMYLRLDGAADGLDGDNGYGETATDLTGAHDGAYNGGTDPGTAPFADVGTTSAHFDGTNEYVEIPNSGDFDLTQGTVQLRFNATDTNGEQGLISRDATGQAQPGHLSVYLNGDDLVVRLQSASQSHYITASNVVTAGDWHQMSFTFGDDGMNLYLDGTLVGSYDYSGGIDGNNEPWAIGASAQRTTAGSNSGLDDYFEGEIAEVAMFDTQLTADHISQLHDEGLDPQPLVTGTTGNDYINGTGNEFDYIDGAAGDDTINGGSGDDRLYGGDGDDNIVGGNGDDLIVGGDGADILDGGAGIDTASYAGSDSGVDVNLSTGLGSGGHAEGDTLSGIENLIGTHHNDTLTGNSGTNVLTGGAGNDVLDGGSGSDTFIFGQGDGSDVAHGGSGGGWTDAILLQNADGSAVEGGWTISLTQGEVQSTESNSLTLTEDSAGTITLTDGSQITFDGMERVDF